jgi:hypothetical protein
LLKIVKNHEKLHKAPKAGPMSVLAIFERFPDSQAVVSEREREREREIEGAREREIERGREGARDAKKAMHCICISLLINAL